jgi:outer membrane protein assembly factor BamD
MRALSSIFSVFLVLLILAGCSKFRKIERSQDWRVKYEGGLRYYDKKDYYRASLLFEQILPIIRGLPEGEKVQFYLAYCQYHSKLYLLAAEQFRSFYETYGRSQFAEEARYMNAYSLYRSSPGPNLDQQGSVESMAAMQQFLNRYPNSSFREKAIEVIVTVQEKLERKGFDNAYQYYKMRQYKAAIVALNNFKNNFPDSKFLEQAHYLVVVSEFRLAEKSIFSKQKDRYAEVVEHYKDFIDRYPNSQYLKEAEKIYTQSLDRLTQFTSKETKNVNS